MPEGTSCLCQLHDLSCADPPQVVDGLVHGARGDSSGDARGSVALEAALAALPIVEGDDVRCRTGNSVSTAAFGEMSECYSHVIHTCVRIAPRPRPSRATCLLVI